MSFLQATPASCATVYRHYESPRPRAGRHAPPGGARAGEMLASRAPCCMRRVPPGPPLMAMRQPWQRKGHEWSAAQCYAPFP